MQIIESIGAFSHASLLTTKETNDNTIFQYELGPNCDIHQIKRGGRVLPMQQSVIIKNKTYMRLLGDHLLDDTTLKQRM